MQAVCWYGTQDIRVEKVLEPKLLNKHDAIVKTTLTAICGSDLHLFNGYIPGMEKGDILGHEFMGEVVEVGTEVRNLKKGDRLTRQAHMWPARMPYQPTVHDLHQNGRLFPPNYLHESWMDYLYWDSVLEP